MNEKVFIRTKTTEDISWSNSIESLNSYHDNEKVLDYETKSDIDNLEKYKSNLEELGYKIEIAIGYGNTAKAICELVKSRELELLVMGTHGHSGFRDLLFGTTLEKVRHRVQIPVLIVK
jgi:manganese transport protein